MAQQTNSFLKSPFEDIITPQGQDDALLPGQQAVKPAAEMPQQKAAEPVKAEQEAPAAAPEESPTKRAPKTQNWLPPADQMPIYEAAAQHFNVPVNVLMALGKQESGYRSNAIGVQTQWGRAKGTMQYLDDTAKGLGINPFDPAEAIPAAAKQLRERLDKGASMKDAVMEHFAGPDRKLWGAKTAAYGDEVLAKADQIGQAYMGGATPSSAQEEKQDLAALQKQLDAEEPGRYKVLPEGYAEQHFSPSTMDRASYEQTFRSVNPGASDAAIANAMQQYDQQAKAAAAVPKQDPAEAKFAALTASPEAQFDKRLNERLQGQPQGIVPPLPAKMEGQAPAPAPSFDPAAADRESALEAAASYLGKSLKAGGYDLLGAGAKVLDAINPFTLSESDAAVLFKNDPAKLKQYQDDSVAMILSRFAKRMSKNSEETMQEVSDRAKRDYGSLEYATTDTSKAAYMSPTKVIGDALRSLPTSAAMAVSVYLTRGAAAQAEKNALAAGLSPEMAKQAAIQAGAKAMATTGAATEGATGYAQQANQTANDVSKIPMAELAKSPKFQQLVNEQGFSPEAARAKIIADTSEEAGRMAGLVDAAVNKVGGEFLGKILTEGGKLIPRIMKGAANESATEFVQSAGEQVGQNKATRDNINPNQSLTEGVAEQAVAGAAVGGLMGGVTAGAGGVARAEVAPEQAAAAPSVPAPSVAQPAAASSAPGPLSRSVENAAEQHAGQANHVTATAPNGEQVSGQVTGYQENEDGSFTAQLVDDDGNVVTLDSRTGVVVQPDATPDAGPLTASLTNAADQNAAAAEPQAAAEVPVATERSAPSAPEAEAQVAEPAAQEPMPAPTEPMPASRSAPAIADMSDEQLQQRLQYIRNQAKESGWDKRFVEARRDVEREIKKRVTAVKPVEVTNGNADGTGNVGVGSDGIPAGVAPVVEGGRVPTGSKRRGRQPAAGRDDSAVQQRDAAPVADDGGDANASVPLKNPYAAYSASSADIAQAYMEKRSIDPAKFEVKQTGKVRWQVVPKYDVAADASASKSIANAEKRKAAKMAVPESTDATGTQASWVIRDKATGAAVMETFDRKKVEALNTEKYEAVPIAKHLAELNDPTSSAAKAAAIPAAEKAPEVAPKQAKPKHEPRRASKEKQDDWRTGIGKARAKAKEMGISTKDKSIYALVEQIDAALNDTIENIDTARLRATLDDPAANRAILEDIADNIEAQTGIRPEWNNVAQGEPSKEPRRKKKAEAPVETDWGDADSHYSVSNFEDPHPDEAKTVQVGIEGKSLPEAADWIAQNHPNKAAREIAKTAADALRMHEADGVSTEFRVAHIGDKVSYVLNREARGETSYSVKKDGSAAIRVALNGSDVAGKVGTSYETALHEIIHAATTAALDIAENGYAPNSAIEEAASDLRDLHQFVQTEINNRISNGGLQAKEARDLKMLTNMLDDPQELLAWGLSNPKAQSFLESIKYQSGNAWTAFVDAIRRLLGLKPSQNTALSEVLRIHEVASKTSIVPFVKNIGELRNIHEIEPRGQRTHVTPAAPTQVKEGDDVWQSRAEQRKNRERAPRYSVQDGKADAEFGPVHTEYRDDAAGAVTRLMEDKGGEAIVHRDDLGDISLVYGDGKMGLSHIARRRGSEFMERLPELLRDGKLYTKPGQPDRVFIGTNRDEAVVRFEWDGKAKTWLLSAYEKYPDLKPAGDVQESRRSQVVDERSAAPASADQVRKAITKGVLGQVVASMIDAGVVVLHDTPKTLPRNAGRNIKGVQAVTTPDGKIHLVASNLTAANANAVMLHEAFHEGAEKLLGTKRWADLMGRMGSLYRQGQETSGKANEFWEKARSRVAAAKAKGGVSTKMEVEEFAAYAIEEYENAPATVKKWVDDLLGMVKAWLVQRFGKQFGDVTPAQLSAIAKWAVMDHAVERRGEIFGDKGLLFSVDDYGDAHRPPSREDGAPLSDLTGEGMIYPDDVYSPNGPRYYGTGMSYDREAFQIANRVRNKPDAEVTIYRAIPSDVDAEINSGDWVAITKQYAVDHGESRFDGDYKIITKKVRAGDIFTNGDSIQEWGYDPQDFGARFSLADDTTTQAADETPREPNRYTPPEQGVLRRAQAAVQDNMNRVKEVQTRIMELTGRTSLGNADYYGAETNRPGRIAARLEDARETMTGPLMEKLAKAGRTPEQLSELLHAQHAEERNEAVAAINSEFPDGGSGMTNAEAQRIIEQYKDDAALQSLAKEARAIAKATLDLKLAYGLMKPADHEMLSSMYENYVPLKGDGEYGPKVKRAMGHEEREEHILENIARDYEQAVVTGEKNLARQTLLQTVLKFPDDQLWTARVPPRGRYVAGKVYSVQDSTGKQVAQFTSPAQVSAFLEGKGASASQYSVYDSAGEQVKEFVKPLQDNEVMVYVNGDPVRLQIHDEKLAAQLRPLNAQQLHPILEGFRKVNRYLSSIYTGYNPAFILRNATRDAMTGTINMLGNEGAAVAAKAWAKYPQAVKALGQWAATKNVPDGKIGRYLTEYRMAGGKTGASYMSDLEQQIDTLQHTYDKARGFVATARYGGATRAGKVAWSKTIGRLAHVVEIANQATENGLRLALYIALREEGRSAGQAAQAAKSVTVDFDRKGASTSALGAIYLFFNPAVQGTANAMKTLFHGNHKAQAWAALGGLVAAGFWAASKGMDDDKDRWLGEQWDTRTKNFIINSGGKQFRMPISQEFAPAYAFGAAMAEASRGESKIGAAGRLLTSFFDAYFPLQGAVRDETDNRLADAAQAATPTVLKPLMESAMNRNAFGSQVVPETENTKDKPDNLKMNRATKNTAYDKAAQGIASVGEAFGAGKYENDITKVSPETLKSLWRTYTGGLGQFITDSAGVAMMTGKDPAQLSDYPIIKDFWRAQNVAPIKGRYYDLSKDAKATIAEFDQAKKLGDGAELQNIVNEKGKLVAMGKMVRDTTKAAGVLADEKVTINARTDLTDAEKRAELKKIEADEENLYRSGIDAFK